jgi:2-aminoadipate transaminase
MTAHFHLAARAARMNPSIIREILKVTEKPGILSMAGGLPSPDSFPIAAIRAATERVLASDGRAALQYAASEGHAPLREWVVQHLAATQGMRVDASQVLITTGSQQGLDLLGKVIVDPGSAVAVERPSYLGALQAFGVYEPRYVPLVDAVAQQARFAYVLPNYQNPTGRVWGAAERAQLVQDTEAAGLPIVEDNPYGELWYDAPPPPAVCAACPGRGIYLGSFSKVLAPSLRLGYVVAPPALYPKLLQAKQAADLHTPGLNQRIAHEVVAGGLLDTHLPAVRAQYKAQRDAMDEALSRELAGVASWQRPSGGMFFWLTLREPIDTLALLPKAVEQGVAFVPGAAFYPDIDGQPAPVNTLRLSFVTLTPEQIADAVAKLARAIGGAARMGGPA